MSLDVWIKKGKKVTVGGRELTMMPLPLTRLFKIVGWLEENSNDVIKSALDRESKEIPNPMVLIVRVFNKIDLSEVALDIFSFPKDPDTGEQINKNLTKEFFDIYLDIPTAHTLVKMFGQLNEVEEIIKNLQSLPIVKGVLEMMSPIFGIPFLNSLQQNMGSHQSKPEGSHSLKSTDSSTPVNIEGLEAGTTTEASEKQRLM